MNFVKAFESYRLTDIHTATYRQTRQKLYTTPLREWSDIIRIILYVHFAFFDKKNMILLLFAFLQLKNHLITTFILFL